MKPDDFVESKETTKRICLKILVASSRYADLARLEMENGNFSNATKIWSDTQEAVMKVADDVVCAKQPFRWTDLIDHNVINIIQIGLSFTSPGSIKHAACVRLKNK